MASYFYWSECEFFTLLCTSTLGVASDDSHDDGLRAVSLLSPLVTVPERMESLENLVSF